MKWILCFSLICTSLVAESNCAGTQAILDMYNCHTPLIDNIDWVERQLRRAAIKAGGTLVSAEFHKFSPYGISGVVIIAESHISIHTWPEYKFVAIDVFTCSEDLGVRQACDYLIDSFNPDLYEINIFKRGQLPEEEEVLNEDSPVEKVFVSEAYRDGTQAGQPYIGKAC